MHVFFQEVAWSLIREYFPLSSSCVAMGVCSGTVCVHVCVHVSEIQFDYCRGNLGTVPEEDTCRVDQAMNL